MSWLWIKKPSWIQSVNPDTINYDLHKGKFFFVFDPVTKKEFKVEAESIVGNKSDARYLEISSKNVSYQCSVIDFYCQIEGKRATKEEIGFFDQMVFDVKTNSNYRRPKWAGGSRKSPGGVWIPPSQKG